MNQKKSILIVDDDISILGSFREILESEGYRVDTAETGKEAIRKAKASHFDLAFDRSILKVCSVVPPVPSSLP